MVDNDLVNQIRRNLRERPTRENRNNQLTMHDFYPAPGDLCTIILPTFFNQYYTYIDNLPQIVIEEKKDRINNLKLLHHSPLDDEVYKGIASMLDNFKEQFRTDYTINPKDDKKSKAIFWSIVGAYLGSKTLKLPQEALEKLTGVGANSGLIVGSLICPGVGTMAGGLTGMGLGYISPLIYGSKQRLKVRKKKNKYKKLNEENKSIRQRIESISNQIKYQDVNVRRGILQDFLQDNIEQYLRNENVEFRAPLPVTSRLDWVGRAFKAIMEDNQAVSIMPYNLQKYYYKKNQQYSLA